MTASNPSATRSRAVKFGSALVVGAALLGSPIAAFAQDNSTAAPAAAAPAPAATAPGGVPAPAMPKPTDVLAKVGNETITGADLTYAAEDVGQQLQSVPPQDREAFLVSVLIDMKIMAQAARTAKLDQTADYKSRLAYLEDRALRRSYFEQNIVPAVTPDAVKAAYDEYVKAFKPQEEVHARHILVKTKQEADDIEAQLKKGAKFEDLAKAKSTDTGSAANGGDLGFFAKGQMVKPFEDAAFSLKVGEVSQPIQTQFGWHIIRVDGTRQTQPTPMNQLAQQLQQQVLFKKFDETVANLKKSTLVSIPDATLAAAVKAQAEANAAQAQPGQ